MQLKYKCEIKADPAAPIKPAETQHNTDLITIIITYEALKPEVFPHKAALTVLHRELEGDDEL